jgi:phosphate transport system substrate-binding protein
MKKLVLTAAICCSLVSLQAQAAGRDTINIVGSSTVYPFATVVAEKFGKKTRFKTPKIESTGSGGGMKLFCAGNGLNTPDITNASRAIKRSEYNKCQKNGVIDMTEIQIGYDGIAFANSTRAPQFRLSRRDLFLALAKKVPAPKGGEKLIENPYKRWNQVNASLPAYKIEVLGPPPTSGTRDAFAELAMEGGCKTFSWIKALKKSDKHQYKSICHTVREDGAYIEAGENDNLIVQKLNSDPKVLGIFGFSFLEQNDDKVQGSIIEGKAPEFETISDGSYPISRPLFFYVKNSHMKAIPGMMQYLTEFTSEAAFGEEGYLVDKGLIPLAAKDRKQMRQRVNTAEKLKI